MCSKFNSSSLLWFENVILFRWVSNSPGDQKEPSPDDCENIVTHFKGRGSRFPSFYEGGRSLIPDLHLETLDDRWNFETVRASTENSERLHIISKQSGFNKWYVDCKKNWSLFDSVRTFYWQGLAEAIFPSFNYPRSSAAHSRQHTWTPHKNT